MGIYSDHDTVFFQVAFAFDGLRLVLVTKNYVLIKPHVA